MTTSWRCVLMGSESLLIQCGQSLVEAGHQVLAVVSTAAPIKRWAAERGIRVLDSAQTLIASHDLRPFDYLFSITNLSVLPPEVISLPTRAAINFHDGLLPDYAGLNTPVWALLNRESEHGITWHLMTHQVDRGGILLQRRMALSPGDTALSLNTQCFEAGVESFELLIHGLLEGSLAPQAQMTPPVHFYTRRHRPPAACAIEWHRDAESIATLVRALDFGNYANPVGCAKAAMAGRPLILSGATIQPGGSDAEPGTVVGVGLQGIVVASADQDLLFERFETLDGKALTPVDAVKQFGIRVGVTFDALNPDLADRLTTLNAEVAGFEGFWQQRLAQCIPVELPYIDRSATIAEPDYHHADCLVPVTSSVPRRKPEDLLALSLVYVARLTDRDAFDVGFSDASLMSSVRGVEGWFATQVPLRFCIDFSKGAAEAVVEVQTELAKIRKCLTYATDLMARTPELRALASPSGVLTLPVALTIVDSLEAAVALPGSELTLAIARKAHAVRWVFDRNKLSAEVIAVMQAQWRVLVGAADAEPLRHMAELALMLPEDRRKVLQEWNDTQGPWRSEVCVHRLIEEQAAQTPEQVALVCKGRALTYRELDHRANQLARRLASLGVGPDVLVGLCTDRSLEMMTGLLAIHKAGGAYVPLDPTYPKDRIACMLEDAKVPVLLTQAHLLAELPAHLASVVALDADWPSIESEASEPFDGGAEPHHLAYVIYTSGSTGKPKGVMVEHRNVVNFFAGMDQHLGHDQPGVWLAVTSLSFDISVLELCWTLTRGFKVVIATHEERAASPTKGPGWHASRPIDFSLFYFSSEESAGKENKYRLLLEGAKYGDQHGFAAVWTPERHFHAFGGLYPNPVITSAAIAAVTQRIQIRAGSVVLPLHHPIRVAEDWSMVDNLSQGRVGVSFASGWQPDDFVLKPENFVRSKEVMLNDIEVVRQLWRGDKVSFVGGTGLPVEIGILPRPVQAELPVWVTSAGNPETFAIAGRMGAKILTHLLGQSVEELAGKLSIYRQAWREAGHPGEGYVSLMLHTLVGPDGAAVREMVRQPMINYLRSSVSLIKQYAWSFPAFKKTAGMDTSAEGIDLHSLSEDEMGALMEHAFNRYYETSGLFGTPQSCLGMVERLKAIGVDDIACLIDFGLDTATVLQHLSDLNDLRLAAAPRAVAEDDHVLPALMQRHQVTHLQCTPSMARMLLLDPQARQGLAQLRRLMVGGEAFPPSLARELKALVRGEVMNMYGPTETTIWSAVQHVEQVDGIVPLGRPLLNQALYVLDTRQQPVPIGVSGELVIGGGGVVRGYLHRPDLTAERFIPDPVRGAAAGRVYRTGDLARLGADGALEFLGRLDHQVKVRGYRIELGEIEAGLMGHVAVREAVVLAREDIPGDVRLVAYFVSVGKMAPSAADLKAYLRDRLPDYMVPAAFVPLPALPQTPNGKVDRKALPLPDPLRVVPVRHADAPALGETEKLIASVWKEVLHLPEVGARDNFFDLGGHSLLAVQVHRKLRDALSIDLSITDIFRFPTVAGLANHLAQGGAAAGGAPQGKERAEGRRAALLRSQARRALGTTV